MCSLTLGNWYYNNGKRCNIKTVFNIKIDFKSKGANFCSKTINKAFILNLRAIAEVRSSSGGG